MAVVGVRQCKRESIGTRTRMAIQVPPESMALIHVQATDASCCKHVSVCTSLVVVFVSVLFKVR
jgi:hypothetical protein